ncbi:MAG: sigma 54-interacting transcriptional regulator [Polyangiales bacterium]
MPCLKWTKAEGRPEIFPIHKKVTSIGRNKANDVSIDSASLCAHHAQIVFDGRDFSVAEVEARKAIKVNGKIRRRSKIFHSDRLSFGEIEMIFSIYDESALPQSSGSPLNDGTEVAGMVKLSEFNRRLFEISAVGDQINALLDAVIDFTHADKGFVLLLENGETLVASARNLKQEDVPDAVTQLSDSIIQRVIETRKPLIVSDALKDTVFGSSESVMNLQLCSVMVAPLIVRGDLLGLIYVGNGNVIKLFDESSLDVLTIFAGQASLLLQNAMLLDELRSDRDELKKSLNARQFGDIVGSCPSMMEVYRRIEKVAPTDVNVLITGETGTGKELVARELHRRSERKNGPFVVVNCGAIPENLLESELFGHVRGAFTGAVATRIGRFQAAHRGTLFLDEIGELPTQLQVKLLRALQERTVSKVGDTKSESVDIRVLAATNRDLNNEVATGTFREDLLSTQRRQRASSRAARSRRRRGSVGEIFIEAVHRRIGFNREIAFDIGAQRRACLFLAGQYSTARESNQKSVGVVGQHKYHGRRPRPQWRRVQRTAST